MRAISQHTYGGPEVLEVVQLPRPEAGPGQVLVKVSAAGVNPADWKIRSGLVRRFGEPPFTLGLDFAGTVEATGEQVYGITFPPGGSYAEYVVASMDAVASKPHSIDHLHAAALPTTGLTAYQSLVHAARVGPGQRVLIHAAAGGIGHLAVQIAKARGAYVLATARREKHEFLRTLGADELIDYTAVDFTTVAHDLDVVLDPLSGDYGLRSLDVLAPGGILLDVRGTGPDRTAVRAKAAEVDRRYAEIAFTPSAEDLRAIAGLVDTGRLQVAISQVFPLEHAAKAHELSQSTHTTGKLVLSL